MGTHPSGASVLAESGETLGAWIRRHPEALGDAATQRFGLELPFLFKVLSIRTALSIQSHPDKVLAEKLHAERPEIYRDPNHKPEMAIALTEFEALCGFAPFSEILQTIELVPEVHQCLLHGLTELKETPPNKQTTVPPVLKAVFTELMLCRSYAPAIEAAACRLQQKANLSEKEALLLRLHAQYPCDIGILAACFLNYLKLQPGEAIYFPANEPHAYLSGDIVECMATSDNVIRAGLTPKLRDTEALCNSLTYSMGRPEVLRGEKDGKGCLVYRPPFEEFEVRKIVPEGPCLLTSHHGPSLLLVYRGEVELQQRTGGSSVQGNCGDVWFVPWGVEVEIDGEDCVLWQARVNAVVSEQA